jgi:EAL domain-containing protein (putative c-di-GMP-specific phosphodiesterase class I)
MGAEVYDRRILRARSSRCDLAERNEARLSAPGACRLGRDRRFRSPDSLRHPQRGDVSPAIFIPIAEESGTILQIGERVLRDACSEAKRWSQPLSVAVNVSTVQLHNPKFPQLVHEILYQTGLPPNRLELEITETALIRDLNRALATLRQLKALGVRIAMDDFGTGYSSLSNLRSFPFDKIKIDGSFIKAIDVNDEAATIVRAVLGLGRGLRLPVLAEGVETSDELFFLNTEKAAGHLDIHFAAGQLTDVGDAAPRNQRDRFPGELRDIGRPLAPIGRAFVGLALAGFDEAIHGDDG